MEPDDTCSREGQKDGTSYSLHLRSDITLIEIETCKNWDAQENKTYTLEELDVFIKCAVSSLISFTLPGTSTSGEGIPAEGYSGLSLDWPTWHSLHFFSKNKTSLVRKILNLESAKNLATPLESCSPSGGFSSMTTSSSD